MARGRRKSKQKRINPTLFVFCEGETEEAYVKMLKSYFRLSSIQIHSKIGGNNITSQYISNYKKDKPTHEKDINYLMYDLDAPEILSRLRKIKDCDLLLSNPCIELWFTLHYIPCHSNQNCDYFNKELKRNNQIYNKGYIDDLLKEKLTSNIDIAIERARKLKLYNNPSSAVYKFLIKLKEQSTS